ncbi:MAG: GuaB3 family IMP dehydrogenase-related protein [Candidatus Margulisbacteria bacterium]|nr:GuaB3 family IMP dehydrogenase-related protein [Candidatus Margulisiibacteriota bacterium]
MTLKIGVGKKTRRAYGFDEIALCPGMITLDPEDVDTSVTIAGIKLEIPIFLAAMDGVINPQMAILAGKLGATGVINLQGVQTRYEDVDKILAQISSVSRDEYVPLMQKIYQEPIKTELIIKRLKEIKAAGVPTIGSLTPQVVEQYGPTVEKAGADALLIQSTVVSTKHKSKKFKPLDLKAYCKKSKIPVMVGNCVTYEVALDLMKAGVAAVFVGIGPGAACTSRGVLGVGVPMATAIADCAGARDDYYQKTKKYVPIIGDGGMTVGGDVCKAIACGADAVMIGSPFAKAKEAPGRGYHWGMATPSPVLPRGSRIQVGTIGTLEEILRGPARYDDGSQNFLGAMQTSMSTLGASKIKEMQQVEVVIAPSILTEGKVYQKAQSLGMYK